MHIFDVTYVNNFVIDSCNLQLVSVAGKPYDTLEEVIGLRGTPGHGSLIEFGVKYRELGVSMMYILQINRYTQHRSLLTRDKLGKKMYTIILWYSQFASLYRYIQLTDEGKIDWDALACSIKPETQCALLQRSCGYSWRDTLTINEIELAVKLIKVCGNLVFICLLQVSESFVILSYRIKTQIVLFLLTTVMESLWT